MAEASVFPGGALDEHDADDALCVFCGGFDGKKAKALLKFHDMDEKTAFSLFFAAIRELYEESSILLAKKSTGEKLFISGESERKRFRQYRKAVFEKKLTLAGLAKLEGLVYTPEALAPFAHWITPKFSKKRYDTWFFLARLPQGQEAACDGNELTSAEWMTPQKAREMNTAREILLMPPTVMTLWELSSFKTIDDLFDHAAIKNIETIMPEPFAESTSAGVKLPTDAHYSDTALKLTKRPGEPTRVIMENGFWSLLF